MDLKSTLLKLYQLNKTPIFIYTKEGDLEECIPSKKDVDTRCIDKVNNFINKFKRDIGDPLYLKRRSEFAAIKTSQRKVIVFTPPQSLESSRKVFLDFDDRAMQSINLYLELLASAIDYQETDESDVKDDTSKYISKEYLENIDNSYTVYKHNQYRLELMLQDAVRSGDIQNLIKLHSIPLHGTEGVLARDKLRSLKNHAHITNVLASRAAISMGASYEQVYRLSDKLFIAVEDCTSCKDALAMRFEISQAFTMQVKEYQELNADNTNFKVKMAINYIKRNVFSKISVEDIAFEVGLNKDYLQRLFKKETNLNIHEYLVNERFSVANDLLENSQDSIKDIASLLHFVDVAHFCREYKRKFFMTPSEYRQQKQVLKN